METSKIDDHKCHNCDCAVGMSQTTLVLAQGLMMPVVAKFTGDDERFGFSIILRVCPSCRVSLLSSCPKDSFSRYPRDPNFVLEDLDIFPANFDRKGYYIQRITRFPAKVAWDFVTVGHQKVPRPRVMERERVCVGDPEYLTMREENAYL